MKLINQPITVNKALIPNRLVMPPMATAMSGDNGEVTQALCDYYAEKSAGGYIGLIITEHCYISDEGKASKGQLSIAGDSCIAGLKRLTNVIHQNGSIAICQINHAGAATTADITRHTPLFADTIPLPRKGNPAAIQKAMTLQDIRRVVDAFANAALRAKASEYDGVEIHSAHGYLLSQFYSPLTNKRTDAYGGDVCGRIKIHLDVIRAIRNAVGADYPIALRLGACDYQEGGSTIEDAVYAAKQFEAAGVDLLDISGGFCGYTRKDTIEPGWFADATAAIKKAVSVPVILTGGITAISDAERLLTQGAADLIGVGRAIFKDSLWAKHAMKADG